VLFSYEKTVLNNTVLLNTNIYNTF